ncbi:MAG: ZIP family metal transporter [Lachnospiraceae bacterium]|nr:ZIP family metal transporter [Lachnospiraceae bacterium]
MPTTNIQILALGVLIPFLGTSLGAASVFFFKGDSMNTKLQKVLSGFAAGVMIAASVWSLLIPAMEQSSSMGKLAFLPALIGFLLGIGALLLIDMLLPHLHVHEEKPEGLKANLKRSTMMLFAVTLHNFPEGMAVGVALAAYISGSSTITLSAALALAIGIAIQNFPEGAIISLPLHHELGSRKKAFYYGFLSGVVEPLGAIITILLTGIMVPILPYLLSFAAGAMIYVVVEELLPEASEGEHSNISTIGFALGFALMMVLDVALG